jgi:hypothetical protein
MEKPNSQEPSPSTRRDSPPIKVWVLPVEKASIEAAAASHSMSSSNYLRTLGLGYPITSTIDQKAVLELMKINADLGRLGGLLKMWLSNEERAINLDRITTLVGRIEGLRDLMETKIESLAAKL